MSRSKFRQSLCHIKLDDAVRSRVRGGDEAGIEDGAIGSVLFSSRPSFHAPGPEPIEAGAGPVPVLVGFSEDRSCSIINNPFLLSHSL